MFSSNKLTRIITLTTKILLQARIPIQIIQNPKKIHMNWIMIKKIRISELFNANLKIIIFDPRYHEVFQIICLKNMKKKVLQILHEVSSEIL